MERGQSVILLTNAPFFLIIFFLDLVLFSKQFLIFEKKERWTLI